MMSNSERHDMNSWFNMMIDKLEPNIDTLNQIDQDRILAIIANEHAAREQTSEAAEIKSDLIKHIKSRKE